MEEFCALPEQSLHLSYSDAIRSALEFQLSTDDRTLIYGLGVDDPKAMYGTLRDFPEVFGAHRCFDTPLSEDSLTGYGIGLAMSGFRPIHVHQRTDFLLLCCNQLINMAAKHKFISDGEDCPFVVRAITGRSWGQGSQHSQSFHSLFANIPGLRVLVPSTPHDAYNTYKNLYREPMPTIVIEHRMLYTVKGEVIPGNEVPSVTKLSSGTDLTICSISHMSLEVERAVQELEKLGLSCDHYSMVDISEPKFDVITRSVQKTGRLLVVDHGWLNCSIASSISHAVSMALPNATVDLMGYANTPCPTSHTLEQYFYPNGNSILKNCLSILNHPAQGQVFMAKSKELSEFRGPF